MKTIFCYFILTMTVLSFRQEKMEVKYKDADALLRDENQKLDAYKVLHIYNPETVIYPPGNRMPDRPIYFVLSDKINKMNNLQTLVINGVFVKDLPDQVKELEKLEGIMFSLSPESDVNAICSKLKSLPKLHSIDLSGSILSAKDLELMRNQLPKVKIQRLEGGKF